MNFSILRIVFIVSAFLLLCNVDVDEFSISDRDVYMLSVRDGEPYFKAKSGLSDCFFYDDKSFLYVQFVAPGIQVPFDVKESLKDEKNNEYKIKNHQAERWIEKIWRDGPIIKEDSTAAITILIRIPNKESKNSNISSGECILFVQIESGQGPTSWKAVNGSVSATLSGNVLSVSGYAILRVIDPFYSEYNSKVDDNILYFGDSIAYRNLKLFDVWKHDMSINRLSDIQGWIIDNEK